LLDPTANRSSGVDTVALGRNRLGTKHKHRCNDSQRDSATKLSPRGSHARHVTALVV